MPNMVVYKATNPSNGKVYIGQTMSELEQRQREHKSRALAGLCYPFHNAIRKYGFDCFKWEILRICDTIESLNAFEQYYILYYDSTNKKNGYNLMDGGGNKGHSEESRKKMSESQKKSAPKYSKIKSQMMKNKWKDPEFKARMLESFSKRRNYKGKDNPNYKTGKYIKDKTNA